MDQQGQQVAGVQTNLVGNVSGPVLSGDFHGAVQIGDINIVPSRQLIQNLQNSLPQDDPLQADLVEFSKTLDQFRLLHNELHEWKQLHNHLNDILFVMGQFDEFVKSIRDQTTPPNVWNLRDAWRPISEKIGLLVDWAQHDIAYIAPQRLAATESGLAGPDWAVKLYVCWKRLKDLLDNPRELAREWADNGWELCEGADELKSETETFMLITDKNLLEAAEKLHNLSIKVFGE